MRFEYPKNVRFECKRCALCCGDTETRNRSILMMQIEAYRIMKKALIDLDEFAEKIECSEPYIYRMRKTEKGQCFFLQDKSCSIYQVRPVICRFYPFQLENTRDDRYVFSYTKECQGIGEKSLLTKHFFQELFSEFMEVLKKNRRS